MSFDLALNRLTHDMEFHISEDSTGSKFRFWFIDGTDKIAQQIKINLLSFLGEWFLDLRYGVPYLEEILVKNPRMASVETIFRNHISSVPDVIRVTNLGLSWNRQLRILGVEFTCETNLGPIKESIKLEIMPHAR